MNQKEVLSDVLCSLKAASDLFLHGTIESPNPNVHETFSVALDETLRMQHETYKLMERLGYYQTQNVEQNKIMQTKDKVNCACKECCN